MRITSREEFDLWQLEAKQITDQLDRIEWSARAILKAVRCPADPVAIYAILDGKQPSPWASKTADRDKLRAKYAMYALVYAQKTRGYLGPNPSRENPRLAAYAALMAGAYAGDIVIEAENAALGGRVRSTKRLASMRAAQSRTRRAASSDATIRAAVAAYRTRHPHSREHSTRALANYIALKLRRKAATIRARLVALKLR